VSSDGVEDNLTHWLISTQVHLMATNIDRLEEDKELVESKMRRLVDLLVDFNKAVRTFGKKGWMMRAWKMHGHVHSLTRLDKVPRTVNGTGHSRFCATSS